MSKQKFSAEKREAIWDAYGRKCAYTGELLDVRNFHIDHIIPESLAKDPAALECKIATLDLPADFDIHGYENLLPCQPLVNLQKHDSIPANAHHFLGVAASKKAKIEAHLDRIKKRNSCGKAAIVLQQCLEHGDLTPGEVSEILQHHSEQPEAIFELIEGMQFADGTEVKSIAKADIEALRDLPIHMGKNKTNGVTLTNNKNEKIHVHTCREYDAALERGYFPYSNYDISMASWFKYPCGLLNSLQTATTPQQSFISNPKVGVVDIQLLPLSLFPVFSDHEQTYGYNIENVTYQDQVKKGLLKVIGVGQNWLSCEDDGLRQHLTEVARADFNGDGIEDILIFASGHATQGSLRFYQIIILTRKSMKGKFEVVEPEVDGVS